MSTSTTLLDGFDAWVHFSAIEMDGYRFLEMGDLVEFDYEPAQQDSFRFVATACASCYERRGPGQFPRAFYPAADALTPSQRWCQP